MRILILAVSILIVLAAGITVAGVIYAFRNDPERKWDKW
jgi:hypothetical protein